MKILGFQDGGAVANLPLSGDVGGDTGPGGTTVTGIGGIPVDVTSPADGEVLSYVAADGMIELTALPLEIKEVDGSPDVTGVRRIRVSNGSLTNDGGGQVTISTSGGGDSIGQFIFGVDGSGSPIIAGLEQDIVAPFTGTITGWTILTDVVGTATIDVWLTNYAGFPPTVTNSIVNTGAGGVKPNISGSTKAVSASVANWSTAVTAGDTLRFHVDSIANIARLVLVIAYSRP